VGDSIVAELVYGDRFGKLAKVSVGCTAIIFDADRARLLLQRRRDNGKWCLPGGQLEAGESAEEACMREVLEEMGLHVRVIRLIGIYTTPHRLIAYADGDRYQLVSLTFEAEVISEELRLSEETTEFGYFAPAEIESLDLMEHHRERIRDAMAGQAAAFIR
jgi:ADP-ribose pyrophosphatase YjhB (NUDIX family)